MEANADTWCVIGCTAVFLAIVAATIALVFALVAWRSTIKSMQAARDDMDIARTTYETALRNVGIERRQTS